MRRWTAETGFAGSGKGSPAMVLVVIAAFCAGGVVSGCKRHMPSQTAPGLRGPVKDLAAIRGGDQLWLTWTVPQKGTGQLSVDGSITVRVCPRERLTWDSTAAGVPLLLARVTTGSGSDEPRD